MKKTLLLILSVIAFVGMSVAQDVYSSGYYINSDHEKVAAVYKNGNMLYSTGSTPSYNHDSYGVLFLNGDVYWVDDCTDSNGDYYYAKVMRNDQVFLETPYGSRSHITCLFTDGMDVYVGGYMDIGGHHNPVVWKNNVPAPYLNFNASNYDYGYILDAMVVDGSIMACGYVYDNDLPGHVGVVWHEDYGQLYSLGDVIAHSIDYYNGSVYTATYDIANQIGAVYQDDVELYTLTDQGGSGAVCIDAGDIYADAYDRVEQYGSIWKNGEKLYDLPHYWSVDCIVANSEGVFYSADRRIWKNDLVLYSFGFENAPTIHDIVVDLDCQNTGARTLPYYEDFETSETDWTCWTQWDGDQQNDGYASYWHRCSSYSVSGNYCAWHRYNGTNDQNGTLTTPLLAIPPGGNATLTFKTYEQFPNDYFYEGIWVIEDGLKVLGDEVWKQNEPSEEWKEVTIDLSAYQGKNIEIDFRYHGLDAHNWYIDDVMITSDFQPCPPVSAPYVERFDTGLGECMYVIEADHDGRCWEWELGCQAAVHPNSVGSNQGGVLLTPSVMLSATKAYQLSFDFRASIPTKGESRGPVEFSVWMVVDGNGLGDLEDFNEIWRRVPVESTSEFETVTIDLTSCSGHSVQFAFVYQGVGEYGWLIDNIAVAEKTGVDENGPSTGSEALVVYPNPANDRIRIEGLEAGNEVQLFNAVGELVKTVKIDENSEIIITDLASGLYLVRFGHASVRFVKE